MAKLKFALLSSAIGGAIGLFLGNLLFKEEEPKEFNRLFGYKSTDKEKYYDGSSDYPDGKGGIIHVTDKEVSDLVKKHLHPSDRCDIRKICEARELAWELLSGIMKPDELPGGSLDGDWYW